MRTLDRTGRKKPRSIVARARVRAAKERDRKKPRSIVTRTRVWAAKQSGRKESRPSGSPLDQALQKMEILCKMLPLSWVLMYRPQLDLIKDTRALLLEEAARQKALRTEAK